jgi:putative isomerase
MDLVSFPFSRYGASVAVCQRTNAEPIHIHHSYHRSGEDQMFRLDFTCAGESIEVSTDVTPEALLVNSQKGKARIVVSNDNTLIIESDSLGCELTFCPEYAYGTGEGDRRHKIVNYLQNLYIAADALRGTLIAEGPMEERPGDILRDRCCNLSFTPVADGMQVRIEINRKEPHPDREVAPLDTDNIVAEARSEWEAFLATMPETPQAYSHTGRGSWYNLWSCFVRAQGNYKYDGIIMSRRFMTALWSWDHCFNAMAMALGNQGQQALEQWLIPFEIISPTGMLPDTILAYGDPHYAVTKPPVHGWALNFILDRHDVDQDMLEHIYGKLTLWTDWWMTYRDADHDGLPEYPLSLDSGWDNTTLLDHGFFLAAPDLAAYLVLQMGTLARLAGMLNLPDDARSWEQRSQKLLQSMLDKLWTGNTFTACHPHTGEQVPTLSSLMTVMPLVLGNNLPADKHEALVRHLRNDFLTENGLATESPDSEFYQADGYWLGPIWAPTTLLLVDGLRRGGEKELSREIAARFCNMVENKARGLFENFDAQTGKGLRAPGYSWTSAVHLVLMHCYLAEDN